MKRERRRQDIKKTREKKKKVVLDRCKKQTPRVFILNAVTMLIVKGGK